MKDGDENEDKDRNGDRSSSPLWHFERKTSTIGSFAQTLDPYFMMLFGEVVESLGVEPCWRR